MPVDKFMDKAWKVGGINLFLGLIAAAVIHLVPGLKGATAAFALLLAAAVTSLSYLILQNRKTLQWVLRSSRIGECLSDLDSPFLRYLSDRLVDQTCNTVEQLFSGRHRKSTIRKPVAMVRWGFSGKNRGGSYFEEPFIVAQIEQIFAELSENAYVYEGVPER